jgi:excisionase family DNA binding protein
MKDEAEGAERRTLTVEEAGAQLGVSRNSAYEAARTGQIPTIKIGKRILVPRAAFERMISGEAA